ncbi:hypothetical protein, partial [Streptomyces syringium]|uniref:hypothetical protein n=1 Tax=Streptomyces syringium TaxID=76729 RepID=UPI00341F91E0
VLKRRTGWLAELSHIKPVRRLRTRPQGARRRRRHNGRQSKGRRSTEAVTSIAEPAWRLSPANTSPSGA